MTDLIQDELAALQIAVFQLDLDDGDGWPHEFHPGHDNQKVHGRKKAGPSETPSPVPGQADPAPAPAMVLPNVLPGAKKRRRATAPKSLASRVQSTIKSEEKISDDYRNSNHVYLLGFDDGSRAVLKVPKGTDEDATKAEFDAEELGASVARALGLTPPEVHRSGDDELYFAHVHDFAPNAVVGAKANRDEVDFSSADAMRIGLLDLLTGNTDRNTGNWFVENAGAPDQRLIPIDHGYAFDEFRESGDKFSGVPPTPNPFMQRLVTRDDGGQLQWANNDLSRAYLGSLRRKLSKTRSEFKRLGRGDWYSFMLARLDAITEHAKGDVTL